MVDSPEGLRTVLELMEWQRRLAGSRDPLQRAKTLWVATELNECLSRCTDAQMAELLIRAEESLPIFEAEFAVIEHARRRLLRSGRTRLLLEGEDSEAANDGGQTMKLLFCEDDDAQLRWLEKCFLSIDGYDTHSAQSADEAWAVYQKNRPFNVVITDFQCGGKVVRDGVELIRAIRKLDPQQACIIQTSERELLLPGVPQLHKPFPIGKLIRMLRLPVQPLLY